MATKPPTSIRLISGSKNLFHILPESITTGFSMASDCPVASQGVPPLKGSREADPLAILAIPAFAQEQKLQKPR